jgi:hypothetical protein
VVYNGADLSPLGQKQIADDATLGAEIIEELDESGDPVMEQAGERYDM